MLILAFLDSFDGCLSDILESTTRFVKKKGKKKKKTFFVCLQVEATVSPAIDNLYLDVNGIIHNCTHPSDDVTVRISEKDMVLAIFNYIDKLFHAIKPRKLFFIAVDGPAPRAKMNQQRARRFRSAKVFFVLFFV